MIGSSQKLQTILVSSQEKQGKLLYKVQKEGIVELRKHRNKKFRVVFNVIPLNNHHPQRVTSVFNTHLFPEKNVVQQQLFSDLNQAQNNHFSKTNHQNDTQNQKSFLSISTKSKEISQNRVIITFNAYLKQQDPPNFVILGYLISSLVLYHNWTDQFSQQSNLTKLLSFLGKLLKKTQIDQLNEDIKFKTGYEKSPYFLCLIGKNPQKEEKFHQNYLNEFYRFQSEKQNSLINQALQTLIDYFPQRSSLPVSIKTNKDHFEFTQEGLQQLQQLGKQFEQKLVGRQLFSFEFTSTSVENLLFEVCECFNSEKEINLVEIYNKVILNKKSRIQSQMIEAYIGLVRKNIFKGNKVDLQDTGSLSSEGSSILPVSDVELLKLLTNLKEIIINEMEEQALNCMNLQQFLQAKSKVLNRIQKYQTTLIQQNHELGVKFLQECYEILNISEQELQIDWKQPTPSAIASELLNLMMGKLSSFSNQCMGLLSQGDGNGQKYNQTFLGLLTTYFQKLQGIFGSALQGFYLEQRKTHLQIETLNFDIKKLTSQKQAIEKEYQLQLLLEAELKAKLKEHILQESGYSSYSSFSTESTPLKKIQSLNSSKKLESSTFNSSKEYYRMKKLIQELQEEVKDKNNHIEELTEILQKFQATLKSVNSLNFYEKKNDKISEETQKLIAEANSKIQKFYQILQEVKNIQKHYENAKKSLMKERQKIIDQKKESLKEISFLKDKNQQIKAENQKLHEIIQQEKKALQKFNTLRDTLKLSINELQTNHTETICALADVEGELQVYRKALNLVVEQYLKGKSQSLGKFYKFLEHKKLKELLKPLIKS